MRRHILVLDFETDGIDPNICSITQIAGLILDPYELKEVKGGTFYMKVKPEGIDDLDKYLTKERRDTILWHAKNRNCTSDDIIKEWQESCDLKQAWHLFSEFINGYNHKKTHYNAVIPAGINIKNFDLPIAERLNDKYNIKVMFWKRDYIDIINLCFYWFENLDDGPSKFSMDVLREFFALSCDGAHDALQDVYDESKIIRKFLLLSRRFSKHIKFKDAFKENKKNEETAVSV